MQIVETEQKYKMNLVANDIAVGETFSTGAPRTLFLRVKATGFLLNSNVIGDVLNRGDLLVVNLVTNTLHALKGDTPVKVVPAAVVLK